MHIEILSGFVFGSDLSLETREESCRLEVLERSFLL